MRLTWLWKDPTAVEETEEISRNTQQVLLEKHFQRKHGPQAYYGQKSQAEKG